MTPLSDVSLICCAVYINDKQLETKKHIQKHAWHFEDGTAVEVEWDMYKPTIGNAVTVTTGESPEGCEGKTQTAAAGSAHSLWHLMPRAAASNAMQGW